MEGFTLHPKINVHIRTYTKINVHVHDGFKLMIEPNIHGFPLKHTALSPLVYQLAT